MQPKLISFVLVLLAFISFSTSRPKVRSGWQPVYQNDVNGHRVFGDKRTLLDAVKRGCPVRVAWGEKLTDGTTDIEYSTPDFTSLVNDSDLVVQFPVSSIQTDYMHVEKSFLKTDPPTVWKALMSTDGHYHQFHQDGVTGQVTRVMYLRASMLWYANMGGEAGEGSQVPDMRIPGGIVLDSISGK
jgi:hypothetical protein